MKTKGFRLVCSEVHQVWHDDSVQPPQVTMAQFLVTGEMGAGGERRTFSLLAMRQTEYDRWHQAELELADEEGNVTTPLLVTEEQLSGEGLTQFVILAHFNPEYVTFLDNVRHHLEELPEPEPSDHSPDDELFTWAPAFQPGS